MPKPVSFLLAAAAIVWGVLLAATPAPAGEDKPLPRSIPGSRVVTAEGVINLAEMFPELVLIDARIPSDYRNGHLEGAVNLPDESITCPVLAGVVPDPLRPVVFYCNGTACRRSERAVRNAVACGYQALYWFRGGFEEWRGKGYPYLTR